MIADKKTYLRHWAELYRSDLVNNIMPFWLEHGLDLGPNRTPFRTLTDDEEKAMEEYRACGPYGTIREVKE